MKSILLLRHADIDPPPGHAGDDWPLNAAGEARAEVLARVAGNAGIASIYVSPALRTQRTAGPLATRLGLQPQESGVPMPDLAGQVLAAAETGAVLVVGHSNTIPELIRELGTPFPERLLRGHDDLLLVTIADAGETGLVRLKYGPLGA